MGLLNKFQELHKNLSELNEKFEVPTYRQISVLNRQNNTAIVFKGIVHKVRLSQVGHFLDENLTLTKNDLVISEVSKSWASREDLTGDYSIEGIAGSGILLWLDDNNYITNTLYVRILADRQRR
jgi:uncharacterized protein YxjI